MAWTLWLRGLVAAFVSAAAGSGALVIVDPQKFNLFGGGAQALGEVALVLGISNALSYLKQHPTPDDGGSVDVRKIGLWLLLAASLTGAAMTTPACAGNRPPIVVPAAKAEAIVQRLAELQNAVISTNTLTPGAIPDAVANPIVLFCVESARVLRDAPNGALPAIAAEWRRVKAAVPLKYRQMPAVAAAYVAVDIALAEFGQ